MHAAHRVRSGTPALARTISSLYDGATTAELDWLSIQTAPDLIGEATAVPGTPQHWLLRVACGLARDVAEDGCTG